MEELNAEEVKSESTGQNVPRFNITALVNEDT